MVRVVTMVAVFVAVALAALLLSGDGWRAERQARALNVEGRAAVVAPAPTDRRDWAHYGGDAGGARYSSLTAVTRGNVASLDVAWTYSTGDMETRPARAINRMASEGTPIRVGDLLVFCTPFNEIIALDPGTGAERWRFDPQINLDANPANQFVCRGLAQAPMAQAAMTNGEPRIFMATADSRLIAVDAETGRPSADFGQDGIVTIDPGMPLDWPGEFQFTSPPAVVGDVVVIGSAISDNARRVAPAGVVRAYDVATGALRWTFDPIPRTAPETDRDWPAGDAPVEGHANAWAPLSVDAARGLVFVPTGSPSPDFFGGLRPGDNRHANAIVALDAATGAVRWAFQTVHHDVWDYDVPAQPSLLTITVDGRARDVVAVVAKTGFVFVLDRETGAPVLPIEERPVPQGGAPGEALSPTQPFPTATPALVPTSVSESDAWGLTGLDKAACRRAIRGAERGGLFEPPSIGGTLIRPFTGGGGNWGGAAFDPSRNLLIVNVSNLVHRVRLIPRADFAAEDAAAPDAEVSAQRGVPYGMRRDVLVSPLQLPCTPPPWGLLVGVDLADGAIVWRRPLGTLEDLSGGALAWNTGTPNFGGPVVTAGGLIFIGAAMDDYLRAFDVETGAELWKGRLPGGGQATPMTYEWAGRQFVVIYAGGHSRAGTRLNDRLIAFALPDASDR
ncbi:MAG: pyrroloquinoline quinone-dependent dehydrogenase [Pseudomonadota bacterium]